jgi:ankyrin repeat protein
LHLAAKAGSDGLLKLLLSSNGSIYAVDENGGTLLHMAATHDNESAVTLFASRMKSIGFPLLFMARSTDRLIKNKKSVTAANI